MSGDKNMIDFNKITKVNLKYQGNILSFPVFRIDINHDSGEVYLDMQQANEANKEQDKALNKHIVMPCAYLVQSKENLLIHGLFSTYEKAEKYINGSPNMAIQKVDIA